MAGNAWKSMKLLLMVKKKYLGKPSNGWKWMDMDGLNRWHEMV